MVNASPESLTTIFVVSVTVMTFFSTSAANRIEDVESPNQRIIGSLSIIVGYSLLFYLALFILNAEVYTNLPAVFTALKIVFAAFIVPGYILLWDLFNVMESAYHDTDFSYVYTVAGGLFVLFVFWGLISIQQV